MDTNNLFRHDGMIPEINSALEILCRVEGWQINMLAQEMKFKTEHHRKGKGIIKHRFPELVQFKVLFKGYDEHLLCNDSIPYSISIGLRRTEDDPPSGRSNPYWDPYEVRTCFTPSEEDATAFMRLHYVGPDEIIIRDIQSVTIVMEDRAVVMRDMQEKPNLGLTKRLENLEEHGIPWAYNDRMLLFGPVAVWLAKRLNVPNVTIRKPYDLPIYGRLQYFINNHVDTNGVNVEYGVKTKAPSNLCP